MLKMASPRTMINSGEYLDAAGKRLLMLAGATDMLNVHGQVTDIMRIGWLAAELGVPVTLGNTFLEFGVHMACALPEVEWLEYSFQNLDHLVEEPIAIVDGWITAPERPGHGLVLSETARREWARPKVVPRERLGNAPTNPRVQIAQPRPVRLIYQNAFIRYQNQMCVQTWTSKREEQMDRRTFLSTTGVPVRRAPFEP